LPSKDDSYWNVKQNKRCFQNDDIIKDGDGFRTNNILCKLWRHSLKKINIGGTTWIVQRNEKRYLKTNKLKSIIFLTNWKNSCFFTERFLNTNF